MQGLGVFQIKEKDSRKKKISSKFGSFFSKDRNVLQLLEVFQLFKTKDNFFFTTELSFIGQKPTGNNSIQQKAH